METSTANRARADRPGLWAITSPQRAFADLLGRRWTQGWVPFVALVAVILWALSSDPDFLASSNVNDVVLDAAITGFLVLALALTVIVGGVDISGAGTYALTSVVVLLLVQQHGVPVIVGILAGIVLGALIGALNGFLIVFIGMRPLLTTLVVLVVLRSIVTLLTQSATRSLDVQLIDDPLWTFIGAGKVALLPVPTFLLLIVCVVLHVLQTRSRIGSHVVATGASARSASEVGIAVRRVKFGCYVLGGALAGTAGVFVAVRFEAISDQIGMGQEFAILATLLLAGVSLAGGVGSIPRVLLATLALAILSKTLINLGVASNAYGVVIAVLLVLAVTLDAKFTKYKGRAIEKLSVAPATVHLSGDLPDFDAGSGTFWAVNRRLSDATAIGLGQVEGPEDCVLDQQGRLYCGDRRGWVWQFSGPDHADARIFSRPGGGPLGMVFDQGGNLIVCASGRGLVSIAPDGSARTLTDRTRRSRLSIADDRRLRLVDDVDITPDGRIWFTEATKRFKQSEWMFDVFESRPNGRLLCYDPRTEKTVTVLDNLYFPNGVCSTHEGDALLIASTSRAMVYRYFHSGDRAGQLEVFMDGLPGYLDNINRSSDGGYWIGFVGVRNPAFDLAMSDVAFKRRMVRQMPVDEWMFPNFNQGFLVKISGSGALVDCLWDQDMTEHSMVTSMREYGDHLFIGGLTNNRVGRIRIESGPACPCGQLPCATRSHGKEPQHAAYASEVQS
jgi:ribose transport system permease protein